MDSKNMTDLKNMTKKTKGRQKIEMKRMSKERNLRVTFSKRRTGVFKKASELATLCGVHLSVIMFSPSNRVFSFGSPNVDSVLQRYTTQNPHPFLNLDLNKEHSTMDESELHAQLNCFSNQIFVEKKRAEDLNRFFKATKDQFWWARRIETMSNAEIDNFKRMLEESKRHLKQKCGN